MKISFYYYLIGLLVWASNCPPAQAQTPLSPLDSLVQAISEYNCVVSSPYGEDDYGLSEQWERFTHLQQIATTPELLALSDHPNGAVRCYAVWALQKRQSIFHLLVRHLTDTARVRHSFSGITFNRPAGVIMLDPINSFFTDKPWLLPQEQATIDSLLILDQRIKLKGRYLALRRLINQKPLDYYYARLRQLATDNADRSEARLATTVIAQYRRPSDLPLIQKLLDSKDDREQEAGLSAAYRYPDASFFRRIRHLHHVEIRTKVPHTSSFIDQLYRTITQYPNAAAGRLLKRALNMSKRSGTSEFPSTGEYHIQAMRDALDPLPSPIFQNVAEQLQKN